MNDSPKSKGDWLNEIDRYSTDWDAIVERVGDRIGAIVVNDWTFTDVAAHLNGWREWTARRLEAAASGATTPVEPWPDGMSEDTDEATNEINAWFQQQSKSRTASEILDETRSQFARIRAAVTAIPEDTLNQSPTWLEGYPLHAVIDGSLGHFYEEHKTELDTWLARNRN